MRSPGGFVFCLVPGEVGERPAPASWPDGRTSYVDQVCLDIPPSSVRRRAGVLGGASPAGGGATRRPGRSSGGSHRARSSRSSCCCSGSTTSRSRSPPTSTGPRPTTRPSWPLTRPPAPRCRAASSRWTVLRDPAGLTYCVTRRRPGDRPEMNDEIGNLTRFLDDHREMFRRKAGGLDRDQLQQTLSPSDLTLGGMVKHLAFVEDWWFGRHLSDAQSEPWASVDWAADAGLGLALRGRRHPRAALGALGGRGRPARGPRWPPDPTSASGSRAGRRAGRRARHPALDPRAHGRGVRAAQRPRRPDPPVDRRPGGRRVTDPPDDRGGLAAGLAVLRRDRAGRRDLRLPARPHLGAGPRRSGR